MLREEVIKANTLVREANQLSEEMGKETEFAVTLQVHWKIANIVQHKNSKSAFYYSLTWVIQVRLLEVLHLDESSRQITERGLLATLTSK